MSPAKSEDPRRTARWKIENTHPDKAKKLDTALREIIDPEIGLNIIELGLVRNIILDDDEQKANVTMIMTTPFCPYAPAILESTRSKAEETLETSTTIEMGMEMWDTTYMEEGLGADWGLF